MTNYTYVVGIAGLGGNAAHATRHDAVGERAILESIGVKTNGITARERLATDPVSA